MPRKAKPEVAEEAASTPSTETEQATETAPEAAPEEDTWVELGLVVVTY